jgi:hypothetical protein
MHKQTTKMADEVLERCARSALEHPETARRGKHKGAAKRPMEMHDELGRLSQKQARQYVVAVIADKFNVIERN